MKKAESFLNQKKDVAKLKQAFADAHQNKEFKEFIKTIPAKEDVLINYTSRLEDASAEYCNCKNCSSLKDCKNEIRGYLLTPEVDKEKISFSYVACKYLNEKLKNDEYKENIELFEMSKDMLDANLKDIYKDDSKRTPIIKYFKEFITDYDSKDTKGLYLHGSFGSGKTYLISALFNEMARRNVRSIICYYPEFLRSLKASFNTSFDERFNALKKVPLLLLDDIGAENCSNWSRDEILGPILQYRMEEHLPTFFTSNLTLEELEKNLSITTSGVDKVKARRIVERIKQLTVDLELISKNRRD